MDQEKKKFPIWFTFITIFMLFYLLSGGPVAYLLVNNNINWSKNRNIVLLKFIRTVYYPHIYASKKSHAYSRYIEKWADLGRKHKINSRK